MNDMKATKISALSRGLAILESVSLATRPLRFSELRAVAPDMPDSTLSRLLRSLEVSGHLARVSDAGYASGPETCRWLAAIRKSSRDFRDVAAEVIQVLTSTTHESAAVALLGEEAIQIVKSQTVQEAIWIIREGQLLHFEADHAASLAILHQLPSTRRREALKSSRSRIRNLAEYTAAVKATRQTDGLWLDHSRERPGICRMALEFAHAGQPGAVFLCLTIESARQRYKALGLALRAAQSALQNDGH